jgi:hypothetical protein
MTAFAPEADTHDHPHERLGRVDELPFLNDLVAAASALIPDVRT